jgi:hypothetical protein
VRTGNKPAKLKAIAATLGTCDEVILATDCDREGQLIGQEILDHLGYRGRVRRALFTAQDPKTLQQAFARLKPNVELRPLYEAAVARQQADQISDISLTRTATRILLTPGVRGVAVTTPTLTLITSVTGSDVDRAEKSTGAGSRDRESESTYQLWSRPNLLVQPRSWWSRSRPKSNISKRSPMAGLLSGT